MRIFFLLPYCFCVLMAAEVNAGSPTQSESTEFTPSFPASLRQILSGSVVIDQSFRELFRGHSKSSITRWDATFARLEVSLGDSEREFLKNKNLLEVLQSQFVGHGSDGGLNWLILVPLRTGTSKADPNVIYVDAFLTADTLANLALHPSVQRIGPVPEFERWLSPTEFFQTTSQELFQKVVEIQQRAGAEVPQDIEDLTRFPKSGTLPDSPTDHYTRRVDTMIRGMFGFIQDNQFKLSAKSSDQDVEVEISSRLESGSYAPIVIVARNRKTQAELFRTLINESTFNYFTNPEQSGDDSLSVALNQTLGDAFKLKRRVTGGGLVSYELTQTKTTRGFLGRRRTSFTCEIQLSKLSEPHDTLPKRQFLDLRAKR